MPSGTQKSQETAEDGRADALAAAGLRRTRTRRAVLDALRAAARPMRVREVSESVATAGDASIDLATVYRTLNRFEKVGLVHRLAGEDGGMYALTPGGAGAATSADAHREHVHFVCSDCGRRFCLTDVPVPRDLASRLTRGRRLTGAAAGATLGRAEVTVFGACGACGEACGMTP